MNDLFGYTSFSAFTPSTNRLLKNILRLKNFSSEELFATLDLIELMSEHRRSEHEIWQAIALLNGITEVKSRLHPLNRLNEMYTVQASDFEVVRNSLESPENAPNSLSESALFMIGAIVITRMKHICLFERLNGDDFDTCKKINQMYWKYKEIMQKSTLYDQFDSVFYKLNDLDSSSLVIGYL